MITQYLISFVLSFLLTRLYIKYALRYSIMDIPNIRSSHSQPVPRGGGISLVFVWYLGLIYMYYNEFVDFGLFMALSAGIPIAIIGFIDDMFKIKPWIRFGVQSVSAMVALYFLGGLNRIDFGLITVESEVFFIVLAFFTILWATNLFNFLDGIDGYIGSELVFIGIAGYLIFADKVVFLIATIALGFLLLNWHPAKVFMGDVGSTFFGFSVAIIAINSQNQGNSIIIWLIITSLFWFDATITLFRRWRNLRKNESFRTLSVAHKEHAYQRYVQSGASHSKTTILAIIINISILLLALGASNFNQQSLLFLVLTIAFLSYILKRIDKITLK